MNLHVTLRDGFGTDIAKGTLAITNDTDTEQIKTWLSTRQSFPLLYSTPHPEFPLTISIVFDD